MENGDGVADAPADTGSAELLPGPESQPEKAIGSSTASAVFTQPLIAAKRISVRKQLGPDHTPNRCLSGTRAVPLSTDR